MPMYIVCSTLTVGKILWSRKWQPTQLFLPGEFHGQRSLAGYSPWGLKELDMAERLSTAQLRTFTFSKNDQDGMGNYSHSIFC